MRAAVGRLGVLRTAFDPSTLDRKRFVRRYDAGATIAELGQEFELTEHEVGVAIRYLELPRRLQVTHRPLQISDRQLAALVAAGHSDTDIATRYRVAVWAVVRRRRRSRLLRPPPNKVRPPLTRAQLKRQLAARTRRHRHGPQRRARHRDALVRPLGLDVVGPRPPSGGGHAVELDPTELRRLYVDEQWSARQIGDHLGVDGAIVTFALHHIASPYAAAATGPRQTPSCCSTRSMPTPPSSLSSSDIAFRYAVEPGGCHAASHVPLRSNLAWSTTSTGTWV